MRVRINFASREYAVIRNVYLALVLSLAAAAIFFAASYRDYVRASDKAATLAKQYDSQQGRLADMTKRLADIKKTVNEAEVKTTMQQADFANAAIRRRAFSWTAFLNRLEAVVPDGVGITSLRPDFQSLEVDISGTALAMPQFMDFVSRLTKSEYFEDIPPTIRTTETVVDKDVGKTVQVFNLKIKYYPGGRDKKGGAGA